MTRFALPLALSAAAVASAFTPTTLHVHVAAPRSALLRMFEMPEKEAPDEVVIKSVTRSREAGMDRVGSLVVTADGGSFYNTRKIFNDLHDFGRYASITAVTDSVVEAKKILISRSGRYSGLLDVLGFHEGAPSSAFKPGDTWLALNPEQESLAAQIDAAAAAGVTRAFLLLSEALADEETLDAKLSASGMDYTVMRTGAMVDEGSGGGLKLGELNMPVCEDVAREDVFRFVTEALTLPEASKRSFSLCPSEGAVSTLKQMRLAGYERRDEVQMLLKGVITEQDAPEELTADEAAEKTELVLRSEAEIAAEREDELKMLLDRARQRGIDTQKKLAYEEAEKLAHRQEQEKYYKAPPESDSDEGADSGAVDDDAEDKPSTPEA